MATGNVRNKVSLKPGFSQLDWMRLMRSAKDPTGLGGKGPRTYTMEEVRRHNSEHDAWTVIRGRVYNITPYLHYHPGGVQELMRAAGDDGTALFNEIHPWVSLSMIERLEVGRLRKGDEPGRRVLPPVPEFSANTTMGEEEEEEDEEEDGGEEQEVQAGAGAGATAEQQHACALDPDRWSSLPLSRIKSIGAGCMLLRFAMPAGQRTGLKTGQHLVLRMLSEDSSGSGGVERQRHYTPISSPEAEGHFDLLVKVYPHGRVSSAVSQLQPGERVDMRGPFGSLWYTDSFVFGRQLGAEELHFRPRHLIMVVAGSGLTPVLQILKVMFKEETLAGKGRITLVFCNRHEDDIILREGLEAHAQKFVDDGILGFFDLHLVLSQPKGSDWNVQSDRESPREACIRRHTGRISASVVEQVLATEVPLVEDTAEPEEGDGVRQVDRFAMTCGPEGFDAHVRELLIRAGLAEDQIFAF
mmetsp:Transcript_4327/g.16949  ORF Transcript_4327/g.16949 Transcript_4327/m.16949 type:complete len:470 (-) Transcript_4327:1206-2615(-)